MANKRKRGKHGPYRRAANEEREFLKRMIAAGWLGSRSAGSHGVADVWLVAPDMYLYFTSPTLLKKWRAFFAGGESGNASVNYTFTYLPPIVFATAAVQLKSSRAAALKAARDWASGKTQREWRAAWEKRNVKWLAKYRAKEVKGEGQT